MKTCTKCKKEQPATLKHFALSKYSNDGFYSWCRGCYREAQRKWSKQHPNYNKEYYQRYYKTIKGYLRCIFNAINRRCNNVKAKDYARYGGRGIKNKFTSDEFIDYVSNILQIDPRGLQIDRIDNNGHYEKGNIRFVTAKVNCNNRKR